MILPPPYDAMDDIIHRRTLCENPAEQQKTARELANPAETGIPFS
ncbi:MAG: hypothetical protein V8T87_14640 [Victivallales bacterium]